MNNQSARKTRHLLDPELHSLADAPDVTLTVEMLPQYREQRKAAIVRADYEALGVTCEEVRVPLTDQPDVRCLLYQPKERSGMTAGYLHIHGGGYIGGSVEASDLLNGLTVSKLGVVLLTVDYRLAPENPIPAPLDDCYAGLAWLHQHADELNVDRDRIGVGGESAGGGLAAAIAIAARDRGEYKICHQHLTYPMIDNLTGTPGHEGDPLVGEFTWTREKNRFGWKSYLGDAPAVAPQVPSRVESYENLPPTWMFTAALDLFRDENIVYARRLLAAGVPTDLVVYAGACHGFQQVPRTKLGARFRADHLSALGRGLSLERES